MRFSADRFERQFELALLWAVPAGAIAGAVLGYRTAGLHAAALAVLPGAIAGPVLLFVFRGAAWVKQEASMIVSADALERQFDLALIWALLAGAIVGAVAGYHAAGFVAAVAGVPLGAIAGPALVFILRGAAYVL